MLIACTVEESRIFLLPELRVAPAKPLHNQRRRANPADFVGGFVVEQRLPLPVYQALLRCRDQDCQPVARVIAIGRILRWDGRWIALTSSGVISTR
jgi:hypothetical protein